MALKLRCFWLGQEPTFSVLELKCAQASARSKAVADAEEVLQAALKTEEQRKARRK